MSVPFGQAMRNWRLKNDLSFRGAGKRFGVTGSYVHRLESGQKQPSHGLLSKMPDELIDTWRDQQVNDINSAAAGLKMLRRKAESSPWSQTT